jgi:hypothetical protein
MDTHDIGCSEGTISRTPSPQFEVVLAYQDLLTALHAKQFLNHVVDHCQLGAEINLTLWKLELFHLPELCQQAVEGACEAPLVILALRGDIGLEANTQNWLAQWITKRCGEESALAVLIDCDMQRLDSVGQTLFQLQDMTQESQVRLFVGFMPSGPAAHISTGKPESENTETILAARDQLLHPPTIVQEGGINE